MKGREGCNIFQTNIFLVYHWIIKINVRYLIILKSILLKSIVTFNFFVALQPKTSLSRPVFEICNHTQLDKQTHSQTVGLPWTSDKLITEAATYTTQETNSMTSARFDHAIPAIKR